VSLLQDRNIILIVTIVSILLVLVYYAYKKLSDLKLLKTVTHPKRGTPSERSLVLTLLKMGFPAETIFHDLYLKKQKNGYSQTDLVLLTEVGLLVFEVKDYSGWIYGTWKDRYWTQVLAYGRDKYRFYNPIMQNNTHIEELKKHSIHLHGLPFYSIVVFYGNSDLKHLDYVPDKTCLIKPGHLSEVIRYILTNSEPANYTNKPEVMRLLKNAVINGANIEIQIEHIRNIRNMDFS